MSLLSTRFVQASAADGTVPTTSNGERLSAILKKLFEPHVSGDVTEELVKAAANGDAVSWRTFFVVWHSIDCCDFNLQAKCEEFLTGMGPNPNSSTAPTANVNGVFAGHTALQAGSQNGHLEVIQVLLNHKADVEIEGKKHRFLFCRITIKLNATMSFKTKTVTVLFIMRLSEMNPESFVY